MPPPRGLLGREGLGPCGQSPEAGNEDHWIIEIREYALPKSPWRTYGGTGGIRCGTCHWVTLGINVRALEIRTDAEGNEGGIGVARRPPAAQGMTITEAKRALGDVRREC